MISQKTCEITGERVTTITVDPHPIDLPAFMAEHLQRAEPHLLRSTLATFVQALMSAEADAICGARYGERSPERINSRNGYRARDFDTRTGTVEVSIPKLRTGSYFPDWLLERRRRAERASIRPGTGHNDTKVPWAGAVIAPKHGGTGRASTFTVADDELLPRSNDTHRRCQPPPVEGWTS